MTILRDTLVDAWASLDVVIKYYLDTVSDPDAADHIRDAHARCQTALTLLAAADEDLRKREVAA